MQNGGLQLSVYRIKFNLFAFHASLIGVSEEGRMLEPNLTLYINTNTWCYVSRE